ncbi:Uncharacterised protein [Chlamydia abortus]|uniref:DUF4177 domain-containing protein n=1 Tax=Paenibacillus residui TaxID=629724 RepID=A0ABW3D949_9BACL|nr:MULTISPECIES: hypothetical protein [Paenibacillaceae]SHE10033.1 Uncharacterised protein [Chlamydia abortus]
MTARWQYRTTTETDVLADWGEQGWELVSVVLVDGREKLYFKKPAPSIREQITLEQRNQVIGGGKEDERK